MPTSPAEAFHLHLHRQARSQRARTLGKLLVPLDADYGIPLRRAPDVRPTSDKPAWKPTARERTLGRLAASVTGPDWRARTKGIEIAAIGGRIHPHYGVFAPIRREYIAR
jgi:hypothetical protein